MSETLREIFAFGPFRLDPGERMLSREGTPVALQPRVLDTLVLLVRRAGQLVRKDDLLAELWPDTHVSEANLTQNVWLLRCALGEEQGGPVYIETVPRAGYRFVAPVSRPAPEALRAMPVAPGELLETGPPRRFRGVLLTLVILALALAAFYPLRQRTRIAAAPAGPPVPEPRRSIAALEFANLSGDPADGWLAAALPEMLAAEIAASGEVRTLPGEAVARIAADQPPPRRGDAGELRRLGARLRVDYLLTGSYLLTGGGPERQVRLDLHLVDARSGETLAAVNDSRSEGRLLALVADGGARLRRSLGLGPLTADEASAWLAALPTDPEARRLYFEGLSKLRAYDAEAARGFLERAIAREPDYPLAHAALASAWISLGYDGKAQDAAKAAAERAASLPREGRLMVEANFYRATRRWDEAIQRLEALFTFYPDETEYGLRLASTLTYAGRGEEALRIVSRLRSLPPPLSTDPRVDLAEADAANGIGDLQRAAAAASAAAAKGKSLGAWRLVAGALASKGMALRDLGRPQAARAALEEALALSRAAGDRFEEARDLHSLGHIVRAQGDVDKAEAMYRRALAMAQEVGNRRAAATALGSLANLAVERGDARQALDSYRQVLAIKREVKDRKGEGIVLYNTGHAHYRLGEMAEAERRFQEALAIRREVGEKAGIGESLYGLAMVRLTRGELAGVPDLLREAEAICRQSGDQETLAMTLAAQGDLLLLQGDVAGALARHRESLRIRREAQLESGIADSLSCVAEDLREAGRLDEAADAARRAVEGFRRAESEDGEALARVTLAGCLVDQGRVEEAQRTLAPLLPPASRSGIEPRLQAGLAAAEVEAAAGRRHRAEELLAAAQREAEEAGLVPYAYEARLARARLELDGGDAAAARLALASLAREAQAKGLGLIAGKAWRILNERLKKEKKESRS
ncbi:MAG TPA: tetratricopeptide repeat protein [Thermoanaerobaculia bacterium]|jgi:DNA-binding winged helix-turn-helix (wHTH) protein/tetratricopeptide (TPR) repeat protein|nr:tetratricopeptide repeat protein [Thermoanaerobaculia bacterium]